MKGHDVERSVRVTRIGRSYRLAGTAIAVAGLCMGGLRSASAATLWSTNSGADSANCGAASSPCRSIGQSIRNANAGDTIMVGPGRYGDLTGDGTFSHPGDEQPQTNPGEFTPLGCIVCIDRPLHIYSSMGAAMTVIEASSSAPVPATVAILRDGVDFGSQDHGFTITGGNAFGLDISTVDVRNMTRNVSVKGNVDVGDGTGFYYEGGHYPPSWWAGCSFVPCNSRIRILVTDNRAINNSTGFSFTQYQQASSIVVLDNEAIGAGTGFAVAPGIQDVDLDQISAGAIQLIGNVAAHGTIGFSADEPGDLKYNTAIDNSQAGFVVTPGGAQFRDNAAIENGGPGVVVNFSPDPFNLSRYAFAAFDYNNFYGNDRRRPSTGYGGFGDFFYYPGPSAHCGVLNLGPLSALYGPVAVSPVPTMHLPASNNYWGSPTGPSSSGPGDAAGGVCDQNSSTTTFKPALPVPASMTGLMPPMP